jgi:two-component sensor histidine kinase
VKIEGMDLRLPSQPATTLAIAVNELIQNALEHGFENVDKGSVRVVLSENESQYEIRVEDDGAGLPKNFNKSSSLGLQIVESLIVEDLRGEFRLANRRALRRAQGGRGTEAILRIPKMKVT